MTDTQADPASGRAGLMRNKRVMTAVCVAAVVVAAAVPTVAAAPRRARLIGEAILQHALRFEGTTVDGLSGIDYDPGAGHWVLTGEHLVHRAAGTSVLAVP